MYEPVVPNESAVKSEEIVKALERSEKLSCRTRYTMMPRFHQPTVPISSCKSLLLYSVYRLSFRIRDGV